MPIQELHPPDAGGGLVTRWRQWLAAWRRRRQFRALGRAARRHQQTLNQPRLPPTYWDYHTARYRSAVERLQRLRDQ